tara:strand:+ start:72699 stop:73385 length:687 start_codon:yes stop_codon:yes gene_type:complete
MTNKGLAPSGAGRSASTFQKTYNSFSGVDMVVTFGGKILGELQGISYTIQREKAPIYSMGEADPRSFSRSKRGIAGSIVFVVFDRSALLEAMRDRPYVANRYSIPEGFEISDVNVDTIEIVPGVIGPAVGSASPTVSRIALDKVIAAPNYIDQVLPFDVVITASNEYGAVARMMIHGVEIMNVGSSLSINDITTDEACTYIATAVTPWKDQGFIKINNDGRSATFVGG